MSFWRVLAAVWQNIRRNRRSFILSSVGLVVGVATLTFFVHLGLGVQQGVLNRIFPVNQIEIEPKTVGIVGLRQEVVDATRLGDDLVKEFARLNDVTRVFPKLRSKLQARLWGGQALFGYAARTEAFFDGLDPALLTDELQALENVTAKRAQQAKRKPEPCKSDDECPLGETCGTNGQCGDVEYWTRFTDRTIALECDGDDNCAPGRSCIAGQCQVACGSGKPACGDKLACSAAGACEPACASDADCPSTHSCEVDVAGSNLKVCRRLRCELATPEDQLVDAPAKLSGKLIGRCQNGVAPDSPACERAACPSGSYCAPRNATVADGFCELPVPAVLSPLVIELFNSSAAVSLGMQKIDGLEAMLGVQFMMHLGNSYFAADLAPDKQAVKRVEIVGFSQKALDFGVTLPLPYVRAFNARYKGPAAAATYDTFILETQGNEDVSRLIAETENFGMALSRKSSDARKAADLLFILTVVFSFISLVILFVAGVNIMHTFLTLVTERRYEIGIMRAIGATRGDIRRLFLTEALMLGLFGGIVGNLVSFGVSRLVNWLAAKYLTGIPFKPDEFFAYDWRVVVGGIAFACAFCLLGAFIPARRAAKLDPAFVLAS
ncbi:MAG: FtsX-like permease family protein [Myxococcota bacterium]